MLFPDTLARIQSRELDPRTLQERNDAYTAFEAAESLVITDPTLTNVNDFRAILINGREHERL
jgi:glycerate 2-kinase